MSKYLEFSKLLTTIFNKEQSINPKTITNMLRYMENIRNEAYGAGCLDVREEVAAGRKKRWAEYALGHPEESEDE